MNELTMDELTERFYAVKAQRDKLLWRLSAIADMAADELRRGGMVAGTNMHQIEADARTVLDEIRGALAEMPRPASTVSLEIAARVWCDQEMRNCVMDGEAAKQIAAIIDHVRRNQADRQSYADLAASGGIVDAP